MKSIQRPVFAILALAVFCLPAAHAAPPEPSATTSAAAAPSASAAAKPVRTAISAYAWPKETSERPQSKEWESATLFEEMRVDIRSWWGKSTASCDVRAVREWVQIECTAPALPESDFELPNYYGSAWAVAGDVSTASAQFKLLSDLKMEPQRSASNSDGNTLMLKMAYFGTIEFQAKYGSAMMVRLDEIFWAEGYDGGGSASVKPGILMDVAWALGEKYPTISLGG